MTRVSEPANYRDGDDPGRTVLCAELPCARDGELWRPATSGWPAWSGRPCATAACPTRGRRGGSRSAASPMSTRSTAGQGPFQALDAWAAAQLALLSFGRLGLFVHHNTHHALAMARAAADALGPDGAFDHAAWAAAREAFAGHVVED